MKNITRDVNELRSLFCPYEFLDLKKCVEIANDVGLIPKNIFDIIEKFKNLGVDDFYEIDPVYCLYDYILQNVKNEIEEKTWKNIQNFDVYWNFSYTSFNFKENEKKELEQILNWLNNENKQSLLENDFVVFFLKKCEINLKVI